MGSRCERAGDRVLGWEFRDRGRFECKEQGINWEITGNELGGTGNYSDTLPRKNHRQPSAIASAVMQHKCEHSGSAYSSFPGCLSSLSSMPDSLPTQSFRERTIHGDHQQDCRFRCPIGTSSGLSQICPCLVETSAIKGHCRFPIPSPAETCRPRSASCNLPRLVGLDSKLPPTELEFFLSH